MECKEAEEANSSRKQLDGNVQLTYSKEYKDPYCPELVELKNNCKQGHIKLNVSYSIHSKLVSSFSIDHSLKYEKV